MKKSLLALSLVVSSAVLGGCSSHQAAVNNSPPAQQAQVYREVTADTPQEKGYVDLNIFSSLKTHKAGSHTAHDTHGTEQYELLVKIDGQAMQLKGNMQEERIEARSLRDPEAGEGVRYQFLKKVRLKGGDHRVSVAIPEDKVMIERELSLPADGSHDLVIEPLYSSAPGGQKPGVLPARNFKGGISSVVLMLNGVSI